MIAYKFILLQIRTVIMKVEDQHRPFMAQTIHQGRQDKGKQSLVTCISLGLKWHINSTSALDYLLLKRQTMLFRNPEFLIQHTDLQLQILAPKCSPQVYKAKT